MLSEKNRFSSGIWCSASFPNLSSIICTFLKYTMRWILSCTYILSLEIFIKALRTHVRPSIGKLDSSVLNLLQCSVLVSVVKLVDSSGCVYEFLGSILVKLILQ